MEQFPIQEAAARLSELIARAEAGEEIVVARGSVPVARLIAYRAGGTRLPGRLKGEIKLAADFDATPPGFAG